MLIVGLLLSLVAGAPPLAAQRARSHGRATSARVHAPRHRATSARVQHSPRHRAAKAAPSAGVKRDSHSRIARSPAAKGEFMKATGYPHGRPGYVVDHVVPLACGGTDAPSNMQWQSVAAARAKDKVERRGCQTARRRR